LRPSTLAAGGVADTPALAGRPGSASAGNTPVKAYIDALRTGFPTAACLAGEERFHAAASAYARANLPVAPAQLLCGEGFERFLGGFASAGDSPCLPGVARLDRFWTEAGLAPDEPPVDPRALASLATEHLMRVVLRPHASARWCWFAAQPIFTIWSRIRASGPGDGADGTDATGGDRRGEGALILRTRGAIRWLPLDASGHAFIVACAHGGTLAEAAAAALSADPDAAGAALLTPLLDAGAFVVAPNPSTMAVP